jgi:hypothetical protein
MSVENKEKGIRKRRTTRICILAHETYQQTLAYEPYNSFIRWIDKGL